jgi:hypothetical protein
MTKEVDVVLYTIPLWVKGYYQPEEPMVMYYSNGSGYPGCPAEFGIEQVCVAGTDIDIYDLMDDEVLELLEDLTLQRIGEDDNR